jgi:hypothetical protein
MAAARVVAMAMGDDGARHRRDRIDMEIARWTIESCIGRPQQVGEFQNGP